MHFKEEQAGIASYPPQNHLNALFGRRPRAILDWITTSTYKEAPFPKVKGSSSSDAMKRFDEMNTNTTKCVNMLDVLKSVYLSMLIRYPGNTDRWIQVRATHASP